MPDAAAAGGASPSGDNPAAAEEEGEPLPAAEAIRLARAQLGVVGKGKPASRWKPYRSSNEGPNPNYDPRLAAAAAGHLEAVEPGGDAA
ncbi:hypothetical protein [Nonomuraea jabiensis]|uniref:hypothetical protein n=1 Tax=Nonomuraea jabiensis TaxID=882448 RepID=UPI003D712DE6